MKRVTVFVLSVCLLSGCSQWEHRREEREVTPRRAGSDYTFKTWPGATTTYTLTLQGVKDTSAHLGPDFTVHYFNFEPEASLALYNGGHPRSSDAKAATRFRAPFGSRQAEWKVTKRENDLRAECHVAEGEDSVWHVIVIAPTEARVREVTGQLGSFRRNGKPAAHG